MSQSERNIARFPIELAQRLARVEWGDEYDFLYYHQNIARIFFADVTTRGLLVNHGTGMGKSMLAASLAMDNLFPAPGAEDGARKRQVIVMLAKSLADNMRGAIVKYIDARRARGGTGALGSFGAFAALPDDARADWIERNFSFVTMNASNLTDQVARVALTSGDEDAEDLLFDAKAAQLNARGIDLSGKFLIIDEAHNFFRAITNGSRNAATLYDAVMRAKDMKLAFLTGTPIASHPFELAMCFNMLVGSEILPPRYDDFMRMFVNTAAHSIANRDKFQNRIFGLVSFVDYSTTPGVGAAEYNAGHGAHIIEKRRAPEFPEEYPIEIVRVPMSDDQYGAYLAAREGERREGGSASRAGGVKVKVVLPMRRFSARETPSLQKPHSEFSSSYRVHSRQLGNYCPPEDVRERMRQVRESAADSAGDLSDSANAGAYLDMVSTVVSPKFSAILERVEHHAGQLGLVYSQFVGLGGLAALARFLDQGGYRGRFAVISGEVSPDERSRIIDVFCATDNMHGEHMVLLLVSATGAEGIDLKNVRHVHILEPYWNFGRIKQVKARAIRNRSHSDLPPEERNVSTYIYMAVAPIARGALTSVAAEVTDDSDELPASGAPARAKPLAPIAPFTPAELTSDEELYKSARESQLLIESFERAIREVSIECAINHAGSDRAAHCRLCSPSDARLFTDDIESDVRVSDPCRPVVSKRIAAQKIKVGDDTFFYREADPASLEGELYGYELFIEDARIRAHRKLPLNDARYPAIIAAIAEDEKK